MSDPQLSLFIPEPMIPAAASAGGRDLWYDYGRCVWVADPFDAFLSDEQLLQKYGPATGKPEARP